MRLKHLKLSNFISLLPSIYPSFPPSYNISRDNNSDSVDFVGDTLFIKCVLIISVFSQSSGWAVWRKGGWISQSFYCILFLCMGERPCGELQQSAVTSHWYWACGRLSQCELMYQDGILSWLVWFKMELQQRRQVNCGLFGDFWNSRYSYWDHEALEWEVRSGMTETVWKLLVSQYFSMWLRNYNAKIVMPNANHTYMVLRLGLGDSSSSQHR